MQSQRATPARRPGGRRASRGTPVQWSERDARLLRLVGEQYALTVEQLARLLDRSPRTARWLRDRWLRAGWIDSRPLVWHGPAFLWLTGSGIRLSGSPYRRWRPNPAMAAHVAAVGDVRLLLDCELRLGLWTCERALARGVRSRSARRAHLPDALLELPGGPVAIEVELSLKSRVRLRAIVEELAACYPRVWYFAAPPLLPVLGELAAEAPWGNVDVHPYPPRAESLRR